MSRNFLLVTVDRNADLLNHALQYYSNCAFDQIFVSILQGPHIDQEYINKVESLVTTFASTMLEMHGHPGMTQATLPQYVVNRFCKDGDWLFMANVDEFHQYPVGIKTLVSRCEENGISQITGHSLDRMGPCGNFPDIGAGEMSIWDSFPVATRLTKNILNGSVSKIVAIRLGAHQPLRKDLGKAQNEIHGLSDIFVHVFKWDSSAFERSRYQVWNHSVEGNPAFIIPLRFLRYSRDNQLDLDDDRLEAFWPCYSRHDPVEGTLSEVCHSADSGPLTILDPVFVKPVRNPAISLKFVEDYKVIYDSAKNKAINISGNGVKVWNQCDGTLTVSEITNTLSPLFDHKSRMEKGVQIFIRELVKQGALYLSD